MANQLSFAEGYRRLDQVASEATARRDAEYSAAADYEKFISSPELHALNDIAQIEIWGTEGRTAGNAVRLRSLRKDVDPPIEGLIPKMLDDTNVRKDEREERAKAYEDDIVTLTALDGEDQFQLCQAKLVMDLRMQDLDSSGQMMARFVKNGMDPSEAADKVKEIYAAKDAVRRKVIKENNIMSAEGYFEKIKHPEPKKEEAEETKKTEDEPKTKVKEPKDDQPEDPKRFAYDQSGISWYRKNRKPELKKLKRRQRMLARAAMLADYAVGTNTWNPGLYEKYAGRTKDDDKDAAKKTPPKSPSKTSTPGFTHDQSGRSWYNKNRKDQIKKLKLGQRIVARFATLADYSAVSAWNPGLYDKYVDSKKRKGKKISPPPTPEADGSEPPATPAPSTGDTPASPSPEPGSAAGEEEPPITPAALLAEDHDDDHPPEPGPRADTEASPSPLSEDDVKRILGYLPDEKEPPASEEDAS